MTIRFGTMISRMGIALPQLIFVRLSLSVAHQLGTTIEVQGREEDARSDDLQKSVPKPAFYNPEIDFCCMLKFEYVHRSRPRDGRLQLLLLPRRGVIQATTPLIGTHSLMVQDAPFGAKIEVRETIKEFVPLGSTPV